MVIAIGNISYFQCAQYLCFQLLSELRIDVEENSLVPRLLVLSRSAFSFVELKFSSQVQYPYVVICNIKMSRKYYPFGFPRDYQHSQRYDSSVTCLMSLLPMSHPWCQLANVCSWKWSRVSAKPKTYLPRLIVCVTTRMRLRARYPHHPDVSWDWLMEAGSLSICLRLLFRSGASEIYYRQHCHTLSNLSFAQRALFSGHHQKRRTMAFVSAVRRGSKMSRKKGPHPKSSS